MKNKFENHYRKLLKKCLINGTERKDRTGVGCYSIFNLSIKFINSLVTFDCHIDNDGTIKPNEK